MIASGLTRGDRADVTQLLNVVYSARIDATIGAIKDVLHFLDNKQSFIRMIAKGDLEACRTDRGEWCCSWTEYLMNTQQDFTLTRHIARSFLRCAERKHEGSFQ